MSFSLGLPLPSPLSLMTASSGNLRHPESLVRVTVEDRVAWDLVGRKGSVELLVLPVVPD
jgi:hypothetical protein